MLARTLAGCSDLTKRNKPARLERSAQAHALAHLLVSPISRYATTLPVPALDFCTRNVLCW